MFHDAIEEQLAACTQWLDAVVALGWCGLSGKDLERGLGLQSRIEDLGMPVLGEALGKVLANFRQNDDRVEVVADPTDSLGWLVLVLETTREAWQLEFLSSQAADRDVSPRS